MEIIGLLLFFVGLLIAFVGGIWYLVVAFKESVWWGLGCLFCGPVSLIFLIMYWAEAHKPFLVSLLGTGLYMIGGYMAGLNMDT